MAVRRPDQPVQFAYRAPIVSGDQAPSGGERRADPSLQPRDESGDPSLSGAIPMTTTALIGVLAGWFSTLRPSESSEFDQDDNAAYFEPSLDPLEEFY